MKTYCNENNKCCNNPALTLTIVRISLGLFYLLFGIMKLFLMGPDAVTAMMSQIYGITGTIPTLLAWMVMLTEFIGGIIILLGNKIPNIIYKLTLIGFIVIPIVGFLSTAIGTKDMMKTLFFHLQVIMVAIALLFSSPKCVFGLTGDKK